MNKRETGNLLDKIASYYPAFRAGNDPKSLLEDWHKILQDTALADALEQLTAYASKPENRFAPHPGALKRVETISDRYHAVMRLAGTQTLQSIDEMRKNAVGPTPEQRRKVRELLGKTEA